MCACRPRLLGYAGLPLVESIPCFFLALFALGRVSRMRHIHERLSRDVVVGYTFDVTTFSVRPSTTSRHEPDDTLRPNPSPHFSGSSSPRAITSSRPSLTNPGPTLTPTFLLPGGPSRIESSTRQFHLPFKSPDESESQGALVSPNPPQQDVHVRVDSLASSAFPTSLHHADSNHDLKRASPYIASGDGEVDNDTPQGDAPSSFVSSVIFNRDLSPKLEPDHEMGISDQELHRRDEDPRYASPYFL
jgi:hypothetical protein